MRGQRGFFDIDDRLKRLSDLGDQLETFRSAVDFELFRLELNAALSYTDRTKGGRPPFDPVLMFKILVIQATNNLSDERAEFLINDRLSLMRFLGFGQPVCPALLVIMTLVVAHSSTRLLRLTRLRRGSQDGEHQNKEDALTRSAYPIAKYLKLV
jgi:hypothetical protein